MLLSYKDQQEILLENIFGNILAVDDNKDDLLIYEYLFKSNKNITVDVASSGEQAIQKMLNFDYDVVLLDIEMPGMDGYETARRIKENEKTKNTPIIFVTGEYNSKKFIEKGFKLGAVDFLTKPIDDNQLINRVKLYLQLSINEKELKLHTEHLEKLVAKRTHDLKIAMEDTESANRFKNEFYANMSHELRTPLHAILTLSKRGATKLDFSDTEKIKFYFSQIRESGEHMLELVNNLLDLNQYELNKHQFNFENIDINQLTKRVLDEYAPQFVENQIDCQYSEEYKELLISLDKKHIATVMRNLLNNAIKFSGTGKFIKIDLSRDDSFVYWSITDKGVGVPENEKEYIFNAFFQSSRTKSKAGGKGLGLTICKKIISAHNGWIDLDCLPEGTQFTFSIPIKQEEI